MEFREDLVIALPDLSESLNEFVEHRGAMERGLIIEVAAIHEGTTANFNHYPATELAAALPSWTSPYPKPVLLHHDPLSEAVGRIIGARMDKEADGTPYVRLQVAITDTEAMKKVKDRRYLTGSVGGKAGKASCTICQADWANASMFDMPCKHRRGKSYNGKLAGIEMGDIAFKEYSFVNMPADQHSGVRDIHAPMQEAEAEEDFRPARFFCLDMAKESITEFGESQRDVLGALRPQEATSLFLGLKGAFLSALAEDSRSSKEKRMPDEMPPEVQEEEEDVLAVAEGLSADLAQPAEEPTDSEEAEPKEGDEETPPEADEESEEEEAPKEESSDEEPEEEEEPEDEGEESEPEASDGEDEAFKPKSDVKPHPFMDKNKDGKCDICTATKEQHTSAAPGKSTDKGTPKDSEETPENASEEAEGNAELQGQIAALQSENAKLSDQNTRLRAALKKNLAERVVDLRIAMGLTEADERDQLVDEYVERTASSLADSLRDLAAMPAQEAPFRRAPHVKPTALGVEGDNDREVVVEAVAPTSPKPTTPEDLFVDVFMGRRPL